MLFDTNVRELYATIVKNIYGEIIKYATKAQSTLKLTETQNNDLLELKVANRKMVEILRYVGELSRNVGLYLNSDNKYIKKEYDKIRNKVVKVLRTIHLFRTEKQNEVYHKKLMELKQESKEIIFANNLKIDELIRNDLITVDMASSLFNDYDNVNAMIDNLIDVADLLYGKTDTLINTK